MMPTEDQIEIKNEGQRTIYEIRKAYEQGILSVTQDTAPKIQVMLNKPKAIKPGSFKVDPKDKAFLKEIIEKVDNGTVKLFTPSTLLNQEVYEGLPQNLKAKADYDILVLLHKIRQIKKLWDEGAKNSYQIMNMIHSLRVAKENLEKMQGDIFVI